MSEFSNSKDRAHLDLSPNHTKEYWQSLGVGDAIAAMEEAENWICNDKEGIEKLLKQFESKLSKTDDESLSVAIGSVCSSVVEFMGFLSSGRALLFFRWLADVNPQITSVLIDEAMQGGADFGVILIERLRVIEKQHLLSRIFSPERLAFVLSTLEDAGIYEVE